MTAERGSREGGTAPRWYYPYGLMVTAEGFYCAWLESEEGSEPVLFDEGSDYDGPVAADRDG